MLSIHFFVYIFLILLEMSLLILLGTILKKFSLFSKSEYKPAKKTNRSVYWRDKLSS